MVKAVVGVDRAITALGGELHADEAALLIGRWITLGECVGCQSLSCSTRFGAD
ncbi:MAG: hypothetical protein NNA18_03320 [Nitrospira sp.]|nr:hypothetical protein [Nitrospira sp.]